ncbi:DUF4416 family protein [Thermosulfurimonas sp. F29]|uniref:DUF4416 family protein n=1 Tax=Thermosulfurimonas sp. F29 TaxID=2867247 RepID=UPI001C838091|nr:DUF4416 family protein [Thermosulfurimonas sp. F29]MBX6422428.1 DUF4416 family protein [Thermosulfurimonas sp. F29]
MSHPGNPPPALYFVSAFGRDRERVLEAIEVLSRKLGPARERSPWFPFDFTDYYAREFGAPLTRAFFFFDLRPQEDLVEVKHWTYEVERAFARGDKRTVNLDPGYLLLSRLVLATFKDFAHRIYLGKGVFAEVTLLFREGSFRPLPWTYPDYAAEETIALFNRMRGEYKKLLKCSSISSAAGSPT